MDWDRVSEVAEKYQERILSLPEVVGISTGVRREAGEAQPCIKIYLRKPVDRGKLEDRRIPWKLEGVPVDIVVTGDIIAFGDQA